MSIICSIGKTYSSYVKPLCVFDTGKYRGGGGGIGPSNRSTPSSLSFVSFFCWGGGGGGGGGVDDTNFS